MRTRSEATQGNACVSGTFMVAVRDMVYHTCWTVLMR